MSLRGRHGVNTRGIILGVLSYVGLAACGSEPADQASAPITPSVTAPVTAGSPSTLPTSTPAAGAPATNAPVTPAAAGSAAPPITNIPVTPPASTGAAGAPAAAAGAPGTVTTPPTTPTTGTTQMPTQGTAPAMDECGLKTKYPGDEYCILPPDKDKGFQMRIGPSNYDNPEPIYILAPGQEITTDTFSATSGNDKEVFFYYRQYRMRPGAHHNIITSGGAGDSGLGQRIGTVNQLSEDYPKGGIIAPENKGVGIRMAPHTAITVSLHSINTTEKPQLREMWVNFWYRDPSEVTDPVKEVFSIAPMAGIAPGQDVVTKGSCTVNGNGRMLWAYGHRHANTVRFTMWRQRGGQKDLVYQGYNWEEPLVLDYSSTVMNPVPDTGPNVEGGWSGILDIKTGDQFVWECHVINKTNGVLNFTNNTYSGEMCILDAETVGGGCN